MSHAPLITVGIASYNYARFLPRAFEALRRQSFNDFEVLYCDDGSTDDSVAMIHRFIAENPCMDIRLVQGENLGVMGNKNRILDHARGEYVMLCDADDWMDDGCLARLAGATHTCPDRVIAGFRNVVESGGKLTVAQVEGLPAHPSKWNQFQHHGCLYRLAVCREHGIRFRSDRYPDDFDFVERFNLYCGDVAFVPEVLYNFYHDGSSASSTQNPSSRWYYLNLFAEITRLTGELLPRLDRQEDAWQLEATVMRIFFADVFATCSVDEYRRLSALLCGVMPDCWHNPLLYDARRTPYRPETFRRARMLALLGRAGLLGTVAALWRALHHNSLHDRKGDVL